MELLGGWVRHTRRLAPGVDRTDLEAAGLDLLARYDEPHRYYHDQRHLGEVVAHPCSVPPRRWGALVDWPRWRAGRTV
ncbi:MAG: hypothetical protein ACTHLJ_03575 [Angustibacter sp.]